MNERVLHVLEYDKILQRLKAHATSLPGERMCGELLPLPYASDAERALQETADAVQRMGQKGALQCGSLFDLGALLSTLAVGGTLDPAALLKTASFLDNAGRVREYGMTRDRAEEERRTDTLTDYFAALNPLTQTASEIRRCILSEDEIASDASAELKQIRRQIASATARVRDVLNKMVNGSARAYLQDAVVTMRGDRYCLPVRAEHKGQVPGIVHDRSSSGSTLFIEPKAVVELNNDLRELSLREEKEIARILSELSAALGEEADALRDNATYMTLLDFIFAKAAYALEIRAVKPVFSRDKSISLLGARHPLIAKEEVVAADIRLGKAHGYTMMVITGPNTGGKTVTLKTTGLLTLMGMSGLMIPAEEASGIGFFREIFADIGDEQSIEQSLSTFSAHMTNTVRILREATQEDLCLFDELGAGTDPTEGAALAIAILNELRERNAQVMATTHYAELKLFAMTTPQVTNASCEFDLETLRPTYRLLTGTPGMSNAFAISERLGLPAGIIDNARVQIDQDKARLETLFADLEMSRRTIEREKEEAERYRKETLALNEKLKEQSLSFDSLGEDILQEAHAEAARILKEAKSFADESIRMLRKKGADEEIVAAMERERTKLNERIRAADKKISDKEKAGAKETQRIAESRIRKGERVTIISMNLTGTVETLPDKDGNLTVRCGIMQVESNVKDLAEAPEEKEESGKEIAKRFSMKQAFEQAGKNKGAHAAGGLHTGYVSAEIQLIGKNTDDALSALDKYLDEAYRAHMPSVRIVHGKGTGTLRAAVQRHLKKVKYIKSFKDGEYGEGDAGVTIATFR